MKKEYWRDIVGYEGLYQVSNWGRVRSLARNGTKGKILKPRLRSDGYLQVSLCKDGKQLNKKVHRLVAEAFLDNPNNLPEVNHLSEDKTDNRVQNLCWVSSKANCNWATRNERISKSMKNRKNSTTIVQCYLDGSVIMEWTSANEIERQLGFKHRYIGACCRGERNRAYGYIWQYKPALN